MPRYARRTRRRPRRYGRRTRRGGYSGTLARYAPLAARAFAMARMAATGLRYVKGLVNSEVLKYDQNSNPDTALNATSGYQVSFVTIGQGDTDASRTGNSIFVRAIRFMLTVQNASTTPVPFTRVRVIVCKDNQEVADQAYPTLSDVLENTGEYAATSALNSATVGRWTKLYDKVKIHDIVQKTSSTFYGYIPMRHHVRYNGTTSADIQKGNIWIVVLCDNTNGAYNNPALHTYQMRTYYHDN